MTVTTFTAKLTANGEAYQGSIHWDKYTPRTLVATICQHLTASTVDYPIWSSKTRFGAAGQEVLIQRMKRQAAKSGLTWVEGAPTRFAPQADPK